MLFKIIGNKKHALEKAKANYSSVRTVKLSFMLAFSHFFVLVICHLHLEGPFSRHLNRIPEGLNAL